MSTTEQLFLFHSKNSTQNATLNDQLMFADGAPVLRTYWANGEPNNRHQNGSENCIATNWDTSGLWNDLWCGELLPFLCQKEGG